MDVTILNTNLDAVSIVDTYESFIWQIGITLTVTLNCMKQCERVFLTTSNRITICRARNLNM